jgi:DeoR/GlpR family transcriptional regulator of sugar metabolism
MSNEKRKLLSPEREQLILQSLGDKVCRIDELSEALGVSDATVRRDLQSLEEQGKVRRVHGGAIRVKFPRTEPLFDEKATLNSTEKDRIAHEALNLIHDSETIFLDGGSTVQALAKLLGSKKGLTVVTNSLMAAADLMESGHHLILVGGEFRALSRTLVGPLTSHIINSLHIDKAFLGTIGLSLEDGISTTDPNEAFTKELIMKRSECVIVMADSSKIGVSSFAVSGSISDIDFLVTDRAISEDAVRKLNKKKIEVIY